MIKWIGIDNYVGNPTFYFFICLIFISIILWPSDAILVGTTQHKGYALMAVLEGIINILLSIWWIHIWGVVGVAAATLTARLATNGWYMFYHSRVVTGIGMKAITRKVLILFINPLLGVLLVLYILNLTDFLGWYKIIINTSAICFVFITLFYFLSLNRDNRHEINSLIRSYCGKS
jgi:O-antigen/teichoic acid export membrane protein